ncbi:MAG: pilus assembly protein PilM, partial [bacterium]
MFTTTNLQHSFGLDIGDLALRFVFLEKKGDYFKIKAYGEKLLPPGLTSEGKIDKPDELAASLANLINQPDFGKLKLKNVITCLPETKTFIKLITIPWPKDHDLTDAIIQEAQKHIPLALDQAYLDWQIVDSQEKEWLKILLGVTPQEIANNYIKLLKLVDLKPTVLEIEAAAIVRSLLPGGETPPKDSFLILDLGATRSSIIIYAKNTIQFSLTVPISGVQITQMLASKTNCSYEKAEELKIRCGLQAKTDNALEIETSKAL